MLSARNTLVLLTCIAIAALFWLLNKLSNPYHSSIVVAAEYVNVPPDKVVIQTLPETLEMQVEGTGWELLRYTISLERPTVVLDISSFAGTSNIPLQNVRNSLAQQLPYSYEVKQVIPGNIPLVLDERTTKQLPVRVRTHISINPQYGMLDSLQVNPKRIEVSGPTSILDTLSGIPTEVLTLLDVQADQQGTLPLAEPVVSSISYAPDQVTYSFTVAPFTEASVLVPVSPIDVDPTRIVLLNKAVQVDFQVPMTRFADTKEPGFAERFKVEAPFTGVTENDSLVNIQLSVVPPFVRKVQLKQETVKFLWIQP